MRCLNGRRTGLLLATLVVAILALAGPADAQVLYGSIVGNVTDSSQAATPGATVTLLNEATNLARETTAGADGGYAFANLPEGMYTVRVSLQGFKEYVTEQVPVSHPARSAMNSATRCAPVLAFNCSTWSTSECRCAKVEASTSTPVSGSCRIISITAAEGICTTSQAVAASAETGYCEPRKATASPKLSPLVKTCTMASSPFGAMRKSFTHPSTTM